MIGPECYGSGSLVFKPSMILSHHCMLCGKALTDPASMSRMIGPECYGSGSLSIPWLRTKAGGCTMRGTAIVKVEGDRVFVEAKTDLSLNCAAHGALFLKMYMCIADELGQQLDTDGGTWIL